MSRELSQCRSPSCHVREPEEPEDQPEYRPIEPTCGAGDRAQNSSRTPSSGHQAEKLEKKREQARQRVKRMRDRASEADPDAAKQALSTRNREAYKKKCIKEGKHLPKQYGHR